MPLPAGVPDAPLMVRDVLYLHGFASSAQSTKGRYFGERLARYGLTLRCPDFNEPEFRTLTVTRMLAQLGTELEKGTAPAVLIGSSLGGSLAILAAERFAASIDRIVLLAPAVMFAKPGHHLLPPERIEQWRTEGALPFFHYGANVEQRLDYAFYEDSLRYNPFGTVFTQPTRIFQGKHDRSVDPEDVGAFAQTRPNVALTLLDDDHQLIASLPSIWEGIADFLELA